MGFFDKFMGFVKKTKQRIGDAVVPSRINPTVEVVDNRFSTAEEKLTRKPGIRATAREREEVALEGDDAALYLMSLGKITNETISENLLKEGNQKAADKIVGEREEAVVRKAAVYIDAAIDKGIKKGKFLLRKDISDDELSLDVDGKTFKGWTDEIVSAAITLGGNAQNAIKEGLETVKDEIDDIRKKAEEAKTSVVKIETDAVVAMATAGNEYDAIVHEEMTVREAINKNESKLDNALGYYKSLVGKSRAADPTVSKEFHSLFGLGEYAGENEILAELDKIGRVLNKPVEGDSVEEKLESAVKAIEACKKEREVAVKKAADKVKKESGYEEAKNTEKRTQEDLDKAQKDLKTNVTKRILESEIFEVAVGGTEKTLLVNALVAEGAKTGKESDRGKERRDNLQKELTDATIKQDANIIRTTLAQEYCRSVIRLVGDSAEGDNFVSAAAGKMQNLTISLAKQAPIEKSLEILNKAELNLRDFREDIERVSQSFGFIGEYAGNIQRIVTDLLPESLKQESAAKTTSLIAGEPLNSIVSGATPAQAAAIKFNLETIKDFESIINISGASIFVKAAHEVNIKLSQAIKIEEIASETRINKVRKAKQGETEEKVFMALVAGADVGGADYTLAEKEAITKLREKGFPIVVDSSGTPRFKTKDDFKGKSARQMREEYRKALKELDDKGIVVARIVGPDGKPAAPTKEEERQFENTLGLVSKTVSAEIDVEYENKLNEARTRHEARMILSAELARQAVFGQMATPALQKELEKVFGGKEVEVKLPAVGSEAPKTKKLDISKLGEYDVQELELLQQEIAKKAQEKKSAAEKKLGQKVTVEKSGAEALDATAALLGDCIESKKRVDTAIKDASVEAVELIRSKTNQVAMTGKPLKIKKSKEKPLADIEDLSADEFQGLVNSLTEGGEKAVLSDKLIEEKKKKEEKKPEAPEAKPTEAAAPAEKPEETSTATPAAAVATAESADPVTNKTRKELRKEKKEEKKQQAAEDKKKDSSGPKSTMEALSLARYGKATDAAKAFVKAREALNATIARQKQVAAIGDVAKKVGEETIKRLEKSDKVIPMLGLSERKPEDIKKVKAVDLIKDDAIVEDAMFTLLYESVLQSKTYVNALLETHKADKDYPKKVKALTDELADADALLTHCFVQVGEGKTLTEEEIKKARENAAEARQKFLKKAAEGSDVAKAMFGEIIKKDKDGKVEQDDKGNLVVSDKAKKPAVDMIKAMDPTAVEGFSPTQVTPVKEESKLTPQEKANRNTFVNSTGVIHEVVAESGRVFGTLTATAALTNLNAKRVK